LGYAIVALFAAAVWKNRRLNLVPSLLHGGTGNFIKSKGRMRNQLLKFMVLGPGDPYESIKAIKVPMREHMVGVGGPLKALAGYQNTAKAHSTGLLDTIIIGAVMGMIQAQGVLATDFTNTVTANNVTLNLMAVSAGLRWQW
jgi:hypothetical protein